MTKCTFPGKFDSKHTQAAAQQTVQFFQADEELHGFFTACRMAARSILLWFYSTVRTGLASFVSEGFHLAAADVGAMRKVVLALVVMAYPMRDGIEEMDLLTAVSSVAEN